MLSIDNILFARMFTQIKRLSVHFPNYPFKIIHLDNASEFTSKTFKGYYTSVGIRVEHSVSHVHTQNEFAYYIMLH